MTSVRGALIGAVLARPRPGPVAKLIVNELVLMPAGVPVGTLAIGKAGAINAALLATSILALKRPELAAKVDAFRAAQTERARNMTLPL